MSKKRVWIGALILLAASTPAFAQVAPEVSVTVGWTFADGVSGDAILAGDGNIYDRIDPEDAFNWGLGVGIPVSENAEVGFLFGQQMTTLLAGGTTETEIGDLTISSYHGYFAYNFGDADAAARPYVLFGLGATSYGSVEFTTRGGVSGEIDGFTNFSTTWGAGIKGYASPHVGYRAGLHWTPTYIKSDAVGWWCDPYWGCYLVGDSQYAHQWSFNGGILFRF